jgi:hypothetical protein
MRPSRVAALLLALPAACSAPPGVRAVTAAPDGVSFAFAAERQDEAMRQAMLYCANLGRNAVLRGVESAADGSRVATYDCR